MEPKRLFKKDNKHNFLIPSKEDFCKKQTNAILNLIFIVLDFKNEFIILFSKYR